jgi:hypothetical protein
MNKYESYIQYTKISKFTDTKIHLSAAQKNLVTALLYEIGQIESIFQDTTNTNLDPSVLLMNFINLEGES